MDEGLATSTSCGEHGSGEQRLAAWRRRRVPLGAVALCACSFAIAGAVGGRQRVEALGQSQSNWENAVLKARHKQQMMALEKQLLHRGDVFKEVTDEQHNEEREEERALRQQDRREEIRGMAEIRAQAAEKHRVAHRSADAQLQRYSDIYTSQQTGASSGLEDDYAVPRFQAPVAEPTQQTSGVAPLPGLAAEAAGELEQIETELQRDSSAQPADQAKQLSAILQGTILQLQGLEKEADVQSQLPVASTVQPGLRSTGPVAQPRHVQSDGFPSMASMLEKYKVWKASHAAGALLSRRIPTAVSQPVGTLAAAVPTAAGSGTAAHWTTLSPVTQPLVGGVQPGLVQVARPTACAMVVSSYTGQPIFDMEGACSRTTGCHFDFAQQTCLDGARL